MNANKFSENSSETLGFSGQVKRIQAILKPNTTSKGKTTTTDRERRRNRMNTLGGDKTRSRSTFRFFKKIAPTDFFFSGKVPFLVRGTESGALEGRVGGESNLICLSPGESWLFFLDKLTTSLPFSSNLYHHLVTHPVPLCFWLSFLFTSPLAENLIERIKHHCL